ncbi:MAG: cation:proton antiporter [Candidatus Acidiferrum sp.]
MTINLPKRLEAMRPWPIPAAGPSVGRANNARILPAFQEIEGPIVAAHSLIFRDIAMVFAAAFFCGIIAWRLRQPILLGYVVAGLLLSPLTPGPHVTDVHTFELMAEVGVILLMFSVGIEFSIPDLLRVKWVALAGAPLGIMLSIGLGTAVGSLLGWPLTQGIAVGCIISVASTMVLMRLLMDRGEMSSDSGRVMITLTLVEDLAVVILTVVLPGLSPTNSSNFSDVAWKIGKSLLLLVPIALAAWKLVPPLLARVEKTCNDEISLMLALMICLAIAALTEAVGLSLALGAFLAGLFLGSSAFAHKLAHQTQSLRDAFVALFFASVGMLIDPHSWVTSWRSILLIVGLVLVGKFVTWFGVVKLFRYSNDTALRVGIGLTQIGEFSFILAQVSLAAGLISKEIYNATLAASLITILANASLFRLLKPARSVIPPATLRAEA